MTEQEEAANVPALDPICSAPGQFGMSQVSWWEVQSLIHTAYLSEMNIIY